jgi:cytochrome c oxidase subunit 3/cytochrome o ubiquinol oxidase subunit 3
MLFASLISTYLIYKGRSVVGPFPHEACDPPKCATHLNAILNIPVTSMSTFVLLMSSLFMVLALAAVENKGKPGYEGLLGSSKFWLMATAIAGATFLGFQAYEFTSFVHEGLTIRTNLFGSSFFTLTGFHGAHVTLGIIMLLSLAAMTLRGRIPGDRAEVVELVGLYWHFVDIVWIVIFTLVYLIPA